MSGNTLSYFLIEPEVSGGFGPETRFDRSGPRLEVTKLHYVFDDWFGDCLVTASPCFLIAEATARLLEKLPATGIAFGPAEISKSDLFKEFNPDTKLPPFAWLKVHGDPGVDDFGLSKSLDLIVSQRVFDLPRQGGSKEPSSGTGSSPSDRSRDRWYFQTSNQGGASRTPGPSPGQITQVLGPIKARLDRVQASGGKEGADGPSAGEGGPE